MDKIGVFLSAREGLDDVYVRAAREVGEWIGRTGRTLVYGGSACGLMEVLAGAVKRAGGRVWGVVPQVITQRGLESRHIDVAFPCADLTDRKATMNRESDVLVALPGGIGTLDELFTVMGETAIGLPGAKSLVLYNAGGCWDTLLAMLDDLHARGFLRDNYRDRLFVAGSVEELEAVLSKNE
ncbi:MAG: TIGR00730 family Rossman fold protein [Bacteroidaceae bacterium]|nr:TIGR00730 family Rossman fold protein [Bacteroidaceae bacterium]